MKFLNNIRDKYRFLASKKYICALVSIPWVIYIFLLTLNLLNRNLIGFLYNDDYYISLIVGGAFGSPSPYTIYTNIILGKFLTLLTELFPAHNWFMLIQLAAIVFSYMAFGVWNIIHNKPLIGYLSSFLFVLATVDSVLCHVSYTKTGAITIIVGLVILTSSLLTDEWKKLPFILSQLLAYIMIFAGALFRKEIGIAIIPFALLMLIYIIRQKKTNLLPRIFSFLGVFLLIFLSWTANSIVYSLDEDWKYFTEYNAVRTELLDYGLPNYDDYTIELYAMGFTREAYKTFESYRFADNEVFSIEALQNIIDFRDSLKSNLKKSDKIENTFKTMVNKSKDYVVFYIMLIFFLAILSISNRKAFIYQVLSAVFGIGEIWLLIYSGRILEHVFYMAIIFSFISVLQFYNADNTDKQRKLQGVVLLSLIGLLTYYACNYYSFKDRVGTWTRDYAAYDSVFEYTSSSDKLFVIDVGDDYDILSKAYNSFGHFSEIPHDNVVLLGSWFVPSPIETDIIANYGDKYNLIKLMATNENVYWISRIDSYRVLFLDFIRQYYDPDAELYVVDVIDDYYILSFFPVEETE